MSANIRHAEMILRLRPGTILLKPAKIESCEIDPGGSLEPAVDAVIEVSLPGLEGRVRFAVEAKPRSTPEAIHLAIARLREVSIPNAHPLIQVPYLGPERLQYLEDNQISGIDLCGNGILTVPGRLLIVRSGNPNQYRESRPLNNPFAGRSALVARTLLARPTWSGLNQMLEWVGEAGADLSQAQASKAVRALEEEMLIVKSDRKIQLQDPERLLNKLGSHWRSTGIRRSEYFRVSEPKSSWIAKLSSDPVLRWAVTGESSVGHYTVFSQAGAVRLAVSDLARAALLLSATPERVPAFADLELIETDEAGFFFDNEVDENGMRWASRVQTWLELQAGDGRQHEAAQAIRQQVLKGGDNEG